MSFPRESYVYGDTDDLSNLKGTGQGGPQVGGPVRARVKFWQSSSMRGNRNTDYGKTASNSPSSDPLSPSQAGLWFELRASLPKTGLESESSPATRESYVSGCCLSQRQFYSIVTSQLQQATLSNRSRVIASGTISVCSTDQSTIQDIAITLHITSI